MTTHVGKPSATGQLTRTTQSVILSGSINDSELESDVCYHLVWRHLVKAMEVTAGLAENNSSLPLGVWVKVTCGLTAYTSASAPGRTLGNEYGENF